MVALVMMFNPDVKHLSIISCHATLLCVTLQCHTTTRKHVIGSAAICGENLAAMMLVLERKTASLTTYLIMFHELITSSVPVSESRKLLQISRLAHFIFENEHLGTLQLPRAKKEIPLQSQSMNQKVDVTCFTPI